MDKNKDNVINFPDRYAIFGPRLRKKIEESIADRTEQPAATVNDVENAICNEIVSSFREFLSNLAHNAGEKLARKVIG